MEKNKMHMYWAPTTPWMLCKKLWINNHWAYDSAIWKSELDSAGQFFWSIPASTDSCTHLYIINQLPGQQRHLGSPSCGLSSSSRLSKALSYNGKLLEQQAPLCSHFSSLLLCHNFHCPIDPIKSHDQTKSANIARVWTQGREEFVAIFVTYHSMKCNFFYC